MPRSLPSMFLLVAWAAAISGCLRWYLRLDEFHRGPVEVVCGVLLIVGAIFALLISPFLIADWLRDRKREAHRRWLQDQTDGPRSSPGASG